MTAKRHVPYCLTLADSRWLSAFISLYLIIGESRQIHEHVIDSLDFIMHKLAHHPLFSIAEPHYPIQPIYYYFYYTIQWTTFLLDLPYSYRVPYSGWHVSLTHPVCWLWAKKNTLIRFPWHLQKSTIPTWNVTHRKADNFSIRMKKFWSR